MAPKATAYFASQTRIALPGSEKKSITAPESEPSAHPGKPKPTPPPAGAITVSVVVRRKAPIDIRSLGKPGARMSRAEYSAKHGPDPASVKLVKAFAKEFGLTAEPARGRAGARCMLTGTAAAMQKAFGVTLIAHEVDGHEVPACGRGRSACRKSCWACGGGAGAGQPAAGEAALSRVATADKRPTFVHAGAGGGAVWLSGGPAASAGQTIGIIELGGGYRPADITAYFKALGHAGAEGDGGAGGQGEERARQRQRRGWRGDAGYRGGAAVAPGAKIAVYFAPNTDQGFIDAIATAVHDTANKPSVISISWGGPESSWTAQAMTALDAACQAAAALGVTITVAAGDNGSTDGVDGRRTTWTFRPRARMCWRAAGRSWWDPARRSRARWCGTSCQQRRRDRRGRQQFFPLPAWQAGANVPKPTGRRAGAAFRMLRAMRIRRRDTSSGGWEDDGDRRDERGGSAVGRVDRAGQCAEQEAGGVSSIRRSIGCEGQARSATSRRGTTAGSRGAGMGRLHADGKPGGDCDHCVAETSRGDHGSAGEGAGAESYPGKSRKEGCV